MLFKFKKKSKKEKVMPVVIEESQEVKQDIIEPVVKVKKPKVKK